MPGHDSNSQQIFCTWSKESHSSTAATAIYPEPRGPIWELSSWPKTPPGKGANRQGCWWRIGMVCEGLYGWVADELVLPGGMGTTSEASKINHSDGPNKWFPILSEAGFTTSNVLILANWACQWMIWFWKFETQWRKRDRLAKSFVEYIGKFYFPKDASMSLGGKRQQMMEVRRPYWPASKQFIKVEENKDDQKPFLLLNLIVSPFFIYTPAFCMVLLQI